MWTCSVCRVSAWQYECVTAALPPAQSHLGPLVHWKPEGGWGGRSVGGFQREEGLCAMCVFLGPWTVRPGQVKPGGGGVGAHVFTFPLMCWYLARQGSSGKGSWENTESSPEEQELRVSGKLGEYCSVGAHRSRYSWRQRNERVGWDHLHSDTSSYVTKRKDTSKDWEAKDVEQTEEHKYHAETQSKKNRDFPEKGERGGGEE